MQTSKVGFWYFRQTEMYLNNTCILSKWVDHLLAPFCHQAGPTWQINCKNTISGLQLIYRQMLTCKYLDSMVWERVLYVPALTDPCKMWPLGLGLQHPSLSTPTPNPHKCMICVEISLGSSSTIVQTLHCYKHVLLPLIIFSQYMYIVTDLVISIHILCTFLQHFR